MTPKTVLISLFNYDLGIRSIASFLKSKGYPVDIISFGQLKLSYEIFFNNYILAKPLRLPPYTSSDLNVLLKLLSQLKPDLVGISFPSTTFLTACAITKKIKENFSIPVIWGGIHPTLCPEECIPHTDMVCIGEGEYPMLEVVQKIENKQPLTGIKNLWIKHQDGSIEKNPLRELISDLDSLPYPDFVDYGNKYLIDRGRLVIEPPIISAYTKYEYPLMSTRGCPFACSYCANSILREIYKDKGPYLRRRSVEHVIEELEYARSKRTILNVRFWDDVFTYDEDWIAKFVELYRKKIALPFACYTHPEYTHKNIIKMLRDAGLVSIDIGIQSGSQEFCRDKFKRYQSNEKIIEFAYFLKELGVRPRYNLIMDNPLEDDEDFNNTFELMLKLCLNYKNYESALYSLCYFPKVEFTLELLKRGMIREEDVEGRNYKALNNFFMCLDLARDKKRLFRDTLIAMIVSGFYNYNFIRRCKESIFFKNHPKILIYFLRLKLWMESLIIYFRLSLNIKSLDLSIIKRKYPEIILHKIIHSLKKKKYLLSYFKSEILCRNFLMVPNQIFEYSLRKDCAVLPINIENDRKKILLRIIFRKSNEVINFLRFFLLMRLLYTGNKIALWNLPIEINDKVTDIELELDFPRFFIIFKNKGIKQMANLIYSRPSLSEGFYLLDVIIFDSNLENIVFEGKIIIEVDKSLSFIKTYSEGYK